MEAPVVAEKVVITEPVTTSDPWQLMSQFYSSHLYKTKVENFFKKKSLAPDVSQKEKERVFLSSDSAEFAFLDFGLDQIDFRFDRSRYPGQFLARLDEYQRMKKDYLKMSRQRLTNEEVLALDESRFSAHSEAAKELVKAGIAPSTNIGRAMVNIILVDLGLESREEAKMTTFEKIKNKYERR